MKAIFLYVFLVDFVCAKNASAPGPIVKSAQSSATSSNQTKQASTIFNATAVENVERPKDTKAFITTLSPSAQQQLGVIPKTPQAGGAIGPLSTLQFNRSAIAAPYTPPSTQIQTTDHAGKSSPNPVVQAPASLKTSSSDSSLSGSSAASSSKGQSTTADVSSSSSNKSQTTSTDSQSKPADSSSSSSSKDQTSSTDSQSKPTDSSSSSSSKSQATSGDASGSSSSKDHATPTDSSSSSSNKSQATSTGPTTPAASAENTISPPATSVTTPTSAPSSISPAIVNVATPPVLAPPGLTITQQIFSIVNTQNISQQVQQGSASTTAAASNSNTPSDADILRATQIEAWDNFLAALDVWGHQKTAYANHTPGVTDPGDPPAAPDFPNPRWTSFVSQGGEAKQVNLDDTFIAKKGDTTFWGQAMLSRDRQRMRKGDPGYRSMGRGLIAGFDKDISADKTFGISGSVNQVVVKPDHSTSKNIVNTYLLITNYTQNLQVASVFGSIFGGVNRSKTENLRTQSYSYTSKMEGLSMGISKPFQWNTFNISPSLSTTGTLVQQNAYRDDTNNYYKSQATRSLMSSLSLGMSHNFWSGEDLSHTLSLTPTVSFNHTIKPKSISIDTGSGLIQVQPKSQPRLSYTTTSGYRFSKNNLSCDVNYGLQLKSKFVGHSLSMKIGQKF